MITLKLECMTLYIIIYTLHHYAFPIFIFGPYTIRQLVDVFLAARKYKVDWESSFYNYKITINKKVIPTFVVPFY